MAIHANGLFGALHSSARAPQTSIPARSRFSIGDRGRKRRESDGLRCRARPPFSGAEALVRDPELWRRRLALTGGRAYPHRSPAGRRNRRRSGDGAVGGSPLLDRCVPAPTARIERSRPRRSQCQNSAAVAGQPRSVPFAHPSSRKLRAAYRHRKYPHDRDARPTRSAAGQGSGGIRLAAGIAGTKNADRYITRTFPSHRPTQPLFSFDRSRRFLMKAILKRVAAAVSSGVAGVSPLAAQNAPSCDPTANTKGDIARAQFSMTRAIAAAEKGNPTADLQEVLRLAGNGNDNPTARAYLRGEAYIVYLMQPNAQAVIPRSALGLNNPTATIDLY